MFAIKGKINSIEKKKYARGVFYIILLHRELKKENFKDVYMQFYCFNEKVIESIEKNNVEVNDVVEFTFYIKAVLGQDAMVGWKNNLMITNMTLLKKAIKKESKGEDKIISKND